MTQAITPAMTPFGTTQRGEDVQKITLTNGDLTVDLLTFGAIVQDVRLAGVDHSLTLGADDLAEYETDLPYHGALVGPIANRISTGRVAIDGMMYELERNQDGRIHLHSGKAGVHARVWTVEDVSADAAVLSLKLADGGAGLPGERTIRAHFSIIAPATLKLEITGTTDQATLMNFANHCYWNLDGTASWEGHSLQIVADRYLPLTADTCPTGDVADVKGTPMDFREQRKLQPADPALDHNFCLSDARTDLRDVLWIKGASGLTLTVATDQPGIQVYDGRTLDTAYAGIVVEAQGWPDAPTHHDFPSIGVTPEAPYHQITTFTFSR